MGHKQQAMPFEQMRQNVQQPVQLLKIMAHETRLIILCMLAQRGRMTVTEMMEGSDISQSAFSQHLKILRDRGLVTTEKQALYVYYTLKNQEVQQILTTLYDIYCAERNES